MELLRACYVWFGICTAVVSARYNTKWSSNKENNLNVKYYAQTGVLLSRRKSMIDHHIGSGNEDQCLTNCTSMVNCISLNIIKKDAQILHCQFFRSSTGVFLQDPRSTFYSRAEPQCYGYCEELSYLKLCAKCSCNSLCNSRLPHYCDCTKKNVKTITDCSQAIKVGKYPLTALYKYNIGSHTMQIMCQLFKFNVVEDLWITIFRRLYYVTEEFKRTRGEYVNGFNKPYQDNYFMGFKAIAELTKTKSWTLGIMLINVSGEEEYIEYDDFMLKEENGKDGPYYTVAFTDVRCKHCILATRHLHKQSELWNPPCPEYEIFLTCFGDENILGYRHYKATTLLLRPKRDIEKSKEMFVAKWENFGTFQGKKSTCVTLKFRRISGDSFQLLWLAANGERKLGLYYKEGYFLVQIRKTNEERWPIPLSHNRFHTIAVAIFRNGDGDGDWYCYIVVDNYHSHYFKTINFDLSSWKVSVVSGGSSWDPFYIKDFYFNTQKLV